MQLELKDHDKETTVEVGEEVWVKPANARCTALWQKGVVTAINSRNNVTVDGMSRHILDVRRVVSVIEDSDDEHEEAEYEDQEAVRAEAEHRYPDRRRRPPWWLGDYTRPTQILMSNCPPRSFPLHTLGGRCRVRFLLLGGGRGGGCISDL